LLQIPWKAWGLTARYVIVQLVDATPAVRAGERVRFAAGSPNVPDRPEGGAQSVTEGAARQTRYPPFWRVVRPCRGSSRPCRIGRSARLPRAGLSAPAGRAGSRRWLSGAGGWRAGALPGYYRRRVGPEGDEQVRHGGCRFEQRGDVTGTGRITGVPLGRWLAAAAASAGVQ
jgi:hypothetical protein